MAVERVYTSVKKVVKELVGVILFDQGESLVIDGHKWLGKPLISLSERIRSDSNPSSKDLQVDSNGSFNRRTWRGYTRKFPPHG